MERAMLAIAPMDHIRNKFNEPGDLIDVAFNCHIRSHLLFDSV